MDTIEALQFKHWLDSHIQKCLRLNCSYDEIFESMFEDHNVFDEMSLFLRTRIGQIWIRKFNGQKYMKWQGE